jgi:integrase
MLTTISRLVTSRLHAGQLGFGQEAHVAKATFTVKWIEGLRRGPTERWYWDQGQQGLGLRLSTKGEAWFVVQYRVKHTARRRRVALGRYGTLTLDEAKSRARRYVSAGLDGKDLYEDRQAKAQRPTFNDLTDQWLELHVRAKRAARTAKDYEDVLRRYVRPMLGTHAVEDIRRTDVLKLHRRMRATPKVANYAVIVGKAAVNFGVKQGLLPLGLDNPFAGVELYNAEGRERFLSEAELVRIGDTLLELEATAKISPWAAAALRLLIFTGARSDEILSLEWAWVNLDESALLLLKSKTGKRRIALNAAAVAVLKAIPRVRGNPYVIVGKKPGMHLVSLQKPWKLVCAKAKVRNCRIHDLRHSYASFAAADGLSLHMIGKLLGHKLPVTTARYAHLAEEALRRANENLGKRLGALLRGRPGGTP